MWMCPACDREFERARQSHVCIPGNSVEESFAGKPPVQRAIYDRIMEHVDTLGPVHLDAVSVGVFLKRDRKLAETRPMKTRLALSLYLPRQVHGERVVNVYVMGRERIVNRINLFAPDDVDAG